MIQPAPAIAGGSVSSLGEVFELPIDSEIFGFRVAEFCPDTSAILAETPNRDWSALREHLEEKRIRLVSARLPASEHAAIAALSGTGFKVVDYAITAHLPRLQRAKLPEAHGPIRHAEAGDLPRLEAIAETSFQFGRYHTDGEFPRDLANLRYRRWVRKAMHTLSEENLVLVLEAAGIVAGFMHLGIEHDRAQLKLGSVDVALENGLLGHQLYLRTLAHLQAAGVREVTAQISAANTAVLNLYAGLGFHFASPFAVLHWHLL